MFIERYRTGPLHFLALHGWSGDHKTFAPVLPYLPHQVTFHAADLPGCGNSPVPNHWSLDAIADEIAADALRLPRPVTLVGNCSGALLALEAARRLGSHVGRLVLIDVFAWMPWYFRVFLSEPIGRYAYTSTFANPVGRWLTNLSLKSKRRENSTLTGGFAETNHEVTYRYLKLFENFPRPETFRHLTAPVDLVFGERSFRAIHQSAVIWTRVLPQTRLWPLPGAGHLPILEASHALAGILFGTALTEDECRSAITGIPS